MASSKTSSIHDDWKSFKTEHGNRLGLPNDPTDDFKTNCKRVDDHNELFAKGKKSYEVKLNKFAHLNHDQFAKAMTCKRPQQDYLNNSRPSQAMPTGGGRAPVSVDWRTSKDKGISYVTDVKDQGQTGSCWAFAATGALEALTAKTNSKLVVSLSEQNLIDCTNGTPYGNHGVDGGLPRLAFDYVKNMGINSEETYPFEGRNGISCRFNKDKVAARCSGYVRLTEGDEEAMKRAVAFVGPVTVGIDASHQSFQFYSSGIYDEQKCSTKQLDHAVLVVGYGTSNPRKVETIPGQDFWIVKNSWGKSWGEGG